MNDEHEPAREDGWNSSDSDAREEPALTREELEEFRVLLEAERQAILRRLSRHVHDATVDQERGGDEMDEANRLSEQAYQMRLADKEQKLLEQIAEALGKIDEGGFGICEGTGEFIGRKRLRARPWARYSVEYKAKQERERGEHHGTM